MVDFNKVISLLMHLLIDILRDCVDVSHELLHIIQLVLSLSDYVVHEGSLSLDLELVTIQRHHLLLLEEPDRLLVVTRSARITVAESLLLVREVHVLLHLQGHLLVHLAELVRDVRKTFLIRLLLLVLLLLTLVRHADIAIVIDKCLKLLLTFHHFTPLVVYLLAQLVAITLSAHLVLHLAQLRQAVLEACHVTLDFLIGFAHFIRYESL